MKCAAFWKHTNLRNNNKIYPCCRFKEDIQTFDGNVEDILHSDKYKELRRASSAGKYISGCEKCYYEEANGKQSLREQFNNIYDTDTVELKFLELGLDNICNLACDGCFEDFSSEWSKIKNPDKPPAYHIRSTKDFNSVPDTVDKILFLGGEPLMTKRHYKVLEQVTNKTEVSVIYNTNGTFMLDVETIKLLKQFKLVSFIVSIDGYGELNNKVRSGSKWENVLSFIQQVKKLKFEISVNSVLHCNNWKGFPSLAEFISIMDLDWTVNVLTYPTHLDIVNIKEKDKLLTLIKSITNLPNKEYILNHIKG
jgi:molybdenum cofactor biosynthesis enzyme MoaA